MAGELLFPSAEWFRAALARLHAEPSVQAAARDFGLVAVGLIIEKGDGLQNDFCIFAKLLPGSPPRLQFADDEDELEELGPDYLVRAPHAVARRFVEAAMAGQRQDLLAPVLNREVKLRGDLQRIVKFAGQHKGA